MHSLGSENFNSLEKAKQNFKSKIQAALARIARLVSFVTLCASGGCCMSVCIHTLYKIGFISFHTNALFSMPMAFTHFDVLHKQFVVGR